MNAHEMPNMTDAEIAAYACHDGHCAHEEHKATRYARHRKYHEPMRPLKTPRPGIVTPRRAVAIGTWKNAYGGGQERARDKDVDTRGVAITGKKKEGK